MKATFAAVITAFVLIPTASAHLIAKPHGTLKQIAKSQKLNLQHVLYVAHHGTGQVARWHHKAIPWTRREYQQTKAALRPHRTLAIYTGSVTGAICSAFGPYCGSAIAVARCESTLNIYARNGQYLGLFQMGDYARGRYGFAWNAWSQAHGAYNYFRDSGFSWSPWECRP